MSVLRHKLVFTVPRTNTQSVLKKLFEYAPERIGSIGEYRSCAFISAGVGQFIPSNQANPALGERGKLETVEEDRVEITVEGDVSSVVSHLKQVY